jgi:hypothetical protein
LGVQNTLKTSDIIYVRSLRLQEQPRRLKYQMSKKTWLL